MKQLTYLPALDLITTIHSPTSPKNIGAVSSDVKSPVQFKISSQGYQMTLDPTALSSSSHGIDLASSLEQQILTIEGFSFTLSRPVIPARSNNFSHRQSSFSATAVFSSFQSFGFSQSASFFYRVLIPLSKPIDFFYSIEDSLITNDINGTSRRAIKFELNQHPFHLCILSTKEQNQSFLAIDCHCMLAFEEFSDFAFSIINSLGYLTGHLAGTHAYFFGYDSMTMSDHMCFYYHSIRPETKSIYHPIYTNPFGHLYNQPSVAQYYYDNIKLPELSASQFSSLCTLLWDSTDLTATIHLILEANVASLVFRPGGYAIALETLSNIIKQPSTPKTNPLTPKTWKVFRVQITNLFDSLQSSLSPTEDISLIEKRINDLNKPTNQARLQTPFKVLGIELSHAELTILNSRNDLLHGRIPNVTNHKGSRSIHRLNSDMFYSSVRLYDILSMLILKRIGYNGYILNHAKLEEDNCDMIIDEPPYRKI